MGRTWRNALRGSIFAVLGNSVSGQKDKGTEMLILFKEDYFGKKKKKRKPTRKDDKIQWKQNKELTGDRVRLHCSLLPQPLELSNLGLDYASTFRQALLCSPRALCWPRTCDPPTSAYREAGTTSEYHCHRVSREVMTLPAKPSESPGQQA